MGLKDQIVKLRKNNLTYNEIAAKLGCAKSTISYHCKIEGLDDIGLKLESLDKGLVRRIQNFLKENTIVDTAVRFGISESTVKKYKKQIAA